MDKMKAYRPLKIPPRPESIKELSPFGEKLLMILRENRLRDNTIISCGNSQTNTRRGFGNGDIMQQLKRWDDGKPNKLLNFSRKRSISVPPFSKMLEASADSLVNTTGRFNSTVTRPTERPNSTGTMNIYNRPSNVLQESCPVISTQNRTSIFADQKKICNKFQVPRLRQTQLLKNNIPKRNFQENNSQFRLQRGSIGNKASEKRLGVEIELGKPCPVKKTTQKTIGDFFTAWSTDMNNSEEDDSEEESVWKTKLTPVQTTMKINKNSSPRFVSSITNSNEKYRMENNEKESVRKIEMTQQDQMRMKPNTDFSQRFASLVTFPDEKKDNQIMFSHRYEGEDYKNPEGGNDFNDDKSEDSFLMTIDDFIGVENTNNLNADDEEDNYTVDIFADDEMKNTRTEESNGTGIDKIRNKLMKFRRSEENDP